MKGTLLRLAFLSFVFYIIGFKFFKYFFIALLAISIILYLVEIIKYHTTTYYKQTHTSYFKVKNDIGVQGEYLTYKELSYLEKGGAKFLFNVYVPKGNGETTEIDSLMICKKGIFVLESKNYSGIISGKAEDTYWHREDPEKGRFVSSYDPYSYWGIRTFFIHQENEFYNPIKQNLGHIGALLNYLNMNLPVYSLVVFSNHCKLNLEKAIMDETAVIYRNELVETISNLKPSDNEFTQLQIDTLYNNLYSLSQASNAIKQKHIDDINKRKQSYE